MGNDKIFAGRGEDVVIDACQAVYCPLFRSQMRMKFILADYKSECH